MEKDNMRIRNCLNCNNTLKAGARFCHHCGQEIRFNALSIEHILSAFFSNFLNFDTKLYRSIKAIWIPNRLTKSFAAGARKNYVHPFRMFFVTLILFFAVANIGMKSMDVDSDDNLENIQKFEVINYLDTTTHNQIKFNRDSLDIDTLKKLILKDTFDYYTANAFKPDIGTQDIIKYNISHYDLYTLSKDSLFAKYNITSRWDKYVINQTKKLSGDKSPMIKFALNNMLWGIILMTLILAIGLKLLYFRHHSYLMEHLLQVSNFHIIILILIGLLMSIDLLFDDVFGPNVYLIAAIFSFLHFLYSLNRYYNEKWYKTLIKTLAIIIIYAIGFVIIFVLIMLLSILFF